MKKKEGFGVERSIIQRRIPPPLCMAIEVSFSPSFPLLACVHVRVYG